MIETSGRSLPLRSSPRPSSVWFNPTLGSHHFVGLTPCFNILPLSDLQKSGPFIYFYPARNEAIRLNRKKKKKKTCSLVKSLTSKTIAEGMLRTCWRNSVCGQKAQYIYIFCLRLSRLGIATASPLPELTTSANKNVLRGCLWCAMLLFPTLCCPSLHIRQGGLWATFSPWAKHRFQG